MNAKLFLFCGKDWSVAMAAAAAVACFSFFVIRLSRGRMTKKWVCFDSFPGLRLLRSLTPGYHMSPLRGFGMECKNLFYGAKLFLFCFMLGLTAYADDPPAQFSSTALKPLTVTEAERIQKLFQPRQGTPVIAIGRSDFVFSGPLVYGFRKLPHEENLSRGQKFLRLPVIRLFVPGPMERPPGGTGKYFAWKSDECSLPWVLAASRPPLAKGPE